MHSLVAFLPHINIAVWCNIVVGYGAYWYFWCIDVAVILLGKVLVGDWSNILEHGEQWWQWWWLTYLVLCVNWVWWNDDKRYIRSNHWILRQPDQVSRTDTMARGNEVLFVATGDRLQSQVCGNVFIFTDLIIKCTMLYFTLAHCHVVTWLCCWSGWLPQIGHRSPWPWFQFYWPGQVGIIYSDNCCLSLIPYTG